MLKRRIIPKILIQSRSIGGTETLVGVTTQNFSNIRVVGDPVSQAKLYESQLADELVILRRNPEQSIDSGNFKSLLSRLAQESFMPLAVGGGINSVDTAKALIASGADKVVVGDAAIKSSSLLPAIASRFGSQCLVVSLDVIADDSGRYTVMTGLGRTKPAGDLCELLSHCESNGAGEILLTDVTRDGQGQGLNLSLGAYATERVPVPVILSGGAGTPAHFGDAFQTARVDAVAAGTFFSRRDQTPMEIRAHMKNCGIPTRIIS